MISGVVLDNGVASNEFWRLLDCADDLSWAGMIVLFCLLPSARICHYVIISIVLYYAGAASAAGTSYTGSLLVTPTGR